MTLEALHRYAHALPGVTEDFPFGEDVLALRVGGKIFGLIRVEERPWRVNLKCEPVRALELRAEYAGVQPGYHMNKTHWNTVHMEDDVPADLIRDLVRHSYDLILASLPAKTRAAIQDEDR